MNPPANPHAPPSFQRFLDPAALARLRGLDVKARLIVEGFTSGLHKSPYHGFSVEFAEHREYVPGDDLRYLDWKVFGKTDRFYLKRFEEETNFSCHLLLDASESMRYRSEHAAVSKFEYAQYLAAALAYLIVQQQDAIGLVTFDHEIRQLLGPSSRPSHLKQLFAIMEQTAPAGETSLGPLLHELAERIRKRGLIVIISDLFDDLAPLMLGLKHFAYRRHDVSLLHVIDPAEQDFPFEEPTLFHGLEGQPDQMAEPRALRRAYKREFEEFLSAVRRSSRDLKMDYTLVRTDRPLDVPLRAFLTPRMRQAGRT